MHFSWNEPHFILAVLHFFIVHIFSVFSQNKQTGHVFKTFCGTCVLMLVTVKDTIYDFASLNIAFLTEVQLNELPKSTGVIVVDSLRITKCFHDGAVDSKIDLNLVD